MSLLFSVSSQSEWHRASLAEPCPLCQREKTCSWAGDYDDPEVICCFNTKSSREARNGLGWLHFSQKCRRHKDNNRWHHYEVSDPKAPDFEYLHEHCREAIDHDDLTWLASELGVSTVSLNRLGIGTYVPWECFVFPMFTPFRRICGLRTRCPRTGAKRAVAGSKNGLFLDSEVTIRGQDVFICEGPTDTAAALDLGLVAIGRPDCGSGGMFLHHLLFENRPAAVVIVQDDDEAGKRGAKALKRTIGYLAPTAIFAPPCEDLRETVRKFGLDELKGMLTCASFELRQTVSRAKRNRR